MEGRVEGDNYRRVQLDRWGECGLPSKVVGYATSNDRLFKYGKSQCAAFLVTKLGREIALETVKHKNGHTGNVTEQK